MQKRELGTDKTERASGWTEYLLNDMVDDGAYAGYWKYYKGWNFKSIQDDQLMNLSQVLPACSALCPNPCWSHKWHVPHRFPS